MSSGPIPLSLLPFHSIAYSDADYADILKPENLRESFSLHSYTNYTNILQFRNISSIANNVRNLQSLTSRRDKLQYNVKDISDTSSNLSLSGYDGQSRKRYTMQFDPLVENHPNFRFNKDESSIMSFLISKHYGVYSNPKNTVYMLIRQE